MTTNETRGSLGRTLLILGQLALAAIFLFAAYAKLKPQAAVPWSGAFDQDFALALCHAGGFVPIAAAATGQSRRAFCFRHSSFFLGLWLLSGVLLRYSALSHHVARSAHFFAVMVRTYLAGLEINCGCFGPGERLGPMTLSARWCFAGSRAGRDHRRVHDATEAPRRIHDGRRSVHAATRQLTLDRGILS